PIEGDRQVIDKQAEHGVAEIVPYEFFPSYPKDSPRFKCNDKKTRGIAVEYTAKAGYKGRDQFTVLDVAASGFAREITYTLNVRALKAESAAKEIPLPEVVVPKTRPKS